MLKSMPKRILSDKITLKVPTSIDRYQNVEYNDFQIKNVHMQNTNETKKATDNTEVVLRSILFVDCRLSKPRLDLWKLNKQAQKIGHTMTLEYHDDMYTVLICDLVTDDTGKPHHYELGLV